MRMLRWISGSHGIGSYRQQLEAIAEEMFRETGQHFSAGDFMKWADLAHDAADGTDTGPEAEKHF
jgi:hypothetical protein